MDQHRPDVQSALGELVLDRSQPNGFDSEIDIPGDEAVVTLVFTDGEFVARSPEYRVSRGSRPEPPRYRLPSRAPRRPSSSRTDLSRAEYQRVWDSVSEGEDTAKIAVAGYTDEAEFEHTGNETVMTLQNTTRIEPSDIVLEIGAGVGRVGAALAPMCKRWIGTDVSEHMVRHARERLQGFSNVELHVTNGWDLDVIESESVDVVYCTVVFMHLDEWERFAYVCEALRILRPGGRVYVDNFTLSRDEGWEFFRHHFEDFHPLDRPPNISKSSTEPELRAYLTRAGFDDVRTQESDFFVWAWGRKPTRAG